MPHQQVSPVSEELRAGEDTRCAAQALRTERIERVEWPAVNKQRGEGMEGGNKFRCTGKWNDEPFDRVIEAEDEGDARDHWFYWAWVAGASLQNLEVTEAA